MGQIKGSNVGQLNRLIAVGKLLPLDEKLKYPAGFFRWLEHPQNKLLFARFSLQAHQMAERRPRYSARTIVEVMRWNTEIRDSSVTFKIQNNMVPGMARLWMLENGWRYPGFFQLRDM